MRRHLPAIVITAAAGVLALAVALLLAGRLPVGEPPAGWQIIRPPHEISALAEQGDFIWAGGKDGVFRINRQSGAIVETLQTEMSLRYVSALFVASDSKLWIGHNRGLTVYDGRAYRTLTRADGLPDNRVNALHCDRAGRLWVGTWGGAAMREGGTWRVLKAADGLADDMVNVIFQDSRGGMWFGSYVSPRGGLVRLDDGQRQVWNTGSGLPHNSVTAITEDDSGTVIVATGFYERGGAVRLAPRGGQWEIVETLRRADGLAGEKVRSLFVAMGAVWFGSENDGIAIRRGGQWRLLTARDGLAHNEVKVMLADSDGNMWIATRDGLTRIGAEAARSVAP